MFIYEYLMIVFYSIMIYDMIYDISYSYAFIMKYLIICCFEKYHKHFMLANYDLKCI